MQAQRRWDDLRVISGSEVEKRFGRQPKPCPFCKSTAIGLWIGPNPHMTCGGCGADGPVFEGRSETLWARQDQAFDAWQVAKR